MTSPSRTLIDLDSTPYYHCIACCVRRAFLSGEDSLTGNSYEHRKSWVVDLLKELANIFAIEVCASAVMSNHYHVDAQTAKSWSAPMLDKTFPWPTTNAAVFKVRLC